MTAEEIKALWAKRAAVRRKEELKEERKAGLKLNLRLQRRAQGLKHRKRTLHFRWKWVGKGERIKHRLYLCHGGRTIAAWPTGSAEHEDLRALIDTKMFVQKGEINPLSRDQRKIMSMARRLREALVSLEDGPEERASLGSAGTWTSTANLGYSA